MLEAIKKLLECLFAWVSAVRTGGSAKDQPKVAGSPVPASIPSPETANSMDKPQEQPKIDIETEFAKLKIGNKGLELFRNLKLSRNEGFDDFAIITQSWHESGSYFKVIGKYNFWGIKKPNNWTGKVLPVQTHEYLNGTRIAVTDYFIDFETCADAVLWWNSLIGRLYKEAFANRNSPSLFFKELCNPKNKYQYATDINYSFKLLELYQQLKSNKTLNLILKNI